MAGRQADPRGIEAHRSLTDLPVGPIVGLGRSVGFEWLEHLLRRVSGQVQSSRLLVIVKPKRSQPSRSQLMQAGYLVPATSKLVPNQRQRNFGASRSSQPAKLVGVVSAAEQRDRNCARH
jgi:hypothetical protein